MPVRTFKTIARLLCLLSLTGCGQVIAIKLPKQDPNPNGFYVCEPAGTGFACQSARVFHQYDRQLLAGEKECDYGIAALYVETSWHGSVTRIQYQCSTPPVGDFPKAEASSRGSR
jgi:hypothetical protein